MSKKQKDLDKFFSDHLAGVKRRLEGSMRRSRYRIRSAYRRADREAVASLGLSVDRARGRAGGGTHAMGPKRASLSTLDGDNE
jgi:hypothetical protein